MKKYSIRRPPILESFELPSREELLNIKPGDFVQLIFYDGDGENNYGERMWVKVTKIEGTYGVGKLENVPFVIESLKFGDQVKFHLGDVIDILKE